MDFTQAAYELHRRYPLTFAAEQIEDVIPSASCEDALRNALFRQDPVVVAMIDEVQTLGLFERSPGEPEPTRPLYQVHGARNDQYVFGSATDRLAADRGVLAA